MKFVKENRQSLGIIMLIILLVILEIVLYAKYRIKLDSYSGILASTAAFLGVILSINSVTSWGNKQKAIQEDISKQSKERLHDKKIKLAEEIMTACYEVEQAILRISNPFTSPDEIQKAQEVIKKRKDVSSDTQKPIEEGVIFLYRFDKELNTINNFMTLKIQAKIYFGEPLICLFDQVRKNIHQKIYVNIQMLLMGQSSRDHKTDGYSMQIWDLSIHDNFMKKIISDMEEILLPLLRAEN
ncbi:hypothetical protein [Candidatus Avelusimicrobium alvi]|uniref:hypothetical protein n=1 Tax=Candidatus Avelusimicrobium alvi TaxID=3416221 RepID=UPI003D0EB4B4